MKFEVYMYQKILMSMWGSWGRVGFEISGGRKKTFK